MHDYPQAKGEREWSLQVEQSLFHSGHPINVSCQKHFEYCV